MDTHERDDDDAEWTVKVKIDGIYKTAKKESNEMCRTKRKQQQYHTFCWWVITRITEETDDICSLSQEMFFIQNMYYIKHYYL
jgi:hypothetical protein